MGEINATVSWLLVLSPVGANKAENKKVVMEVKILQVCPRYYPYIGGIETHVEEISERLVERGWNVEVITTKHFGGLKRSEEINGVRVTRFPSLSPNSSYHFALGMTKHIRKEKNGLIHAHAYHALPACQVAWLSNKSRFIFTPHYKGGTQSRIRELAHKIYKPIAKKIFEKSDKIICVSKYEKSRIKQDFQVSEDKLCLIPNGVNFEEFQGVQVQEKDHKTILCVSRLESYKGIQYLLGAMPKLPLDVHLDIVGKGLYKKELVNIVGKLNIEDRVHFFQDLTRKELAKKYVAADLFALLSKYEAYGLVVAEALSSGTPCVLANTTALSEWIDGESCFGITYPIHVDRLVKLIEENIGRKVLQNRNLRSWKEAVTDLEKVYYEVC